MRRSTVLWLTLAVVVAAVIAAALSHSRAPRLQVSYANVTRGAIAREVLTSGTLEPAREVEAGAQVSGTVQTLHADFNSRVKAGQVIAELDPSVYDAQLTQARARLIQADAQAEQRRVAADDARVKLGRARELASNDLIPNSELETAELAAKQADADLQSAAAAVKAARADVARAEVDRSHTVIRSPIDGVVVSRNVEVGQTLASRLEPPVLFRIADLRRMQMLTAVGESEVGGVRPGTEVSFQIESLGPGRMKGVISEVRLQPVLESATGATGNSNTRNAATATTGTAATGTTTASTQGAAASSGATSSTNPNAASTTSATPAGSVVSYTAIVDVDNRDGRIAPGTTAIVMLPTGRRDNALRVPNNALSFRPSAAVLEAAGQQSLKIASVDEHAGDRRSDGRAGIVWKFENGKFAPVPVRTGVADERWTEILSGEVGAGDRVVIAAAAGTSPGPAAAPAR